MPNGQRLNHHRMELRQNLASPGFTASVWTISGVILTACSDIEEFLGLDDVDRGRSVSVNASPVEGARLYFNMNDDDVVDEQDVRLQNEKYPDGFVTGVDGRAVGIPAELHGSAFIALLDGAQNSDTGQALAGQYRALSDANGHYRIASPITDLIREAMDDANQPDTLDDVISKILTHQGQAPNDEDRDALLRAILNPASYLDGARGDVRVEALAKYLVDNKAKALVGRGETLDAQITEAQRITSEIAAADTDTIIILNEDADNDASNGVQVGFEIGAHDSYVGSINAVASVGASLTYTIIGGGGYDIDARGIITASPPEGAAFPTNSAGTLRIAVSNGEPDSDQIVEATITIDDTHALRLNSGGDAGAIDENDDSGAPIISGIVVSGGAGTPTPDDFTIRDGFPDAFMSLADQFIMQSDGNGAWNLRLKPDAVLNYEAIPEGAFNLYVSVRNADDKHSNILNLRVAVNDGDDAPAVYAINGVVEAGATLSVEEISADEDGIAIAPNYQWFINTDTPENAISGATEASYTLQPNDNPLAVYGVRITYTDNYNAGLETGAPTIVIARTSSVVFDAGAGSRIITLAEGDKVPSDLEAIFSASTITEGAPTIRYTLTDPSGLFVLGRDGDGNDILTFAGNTALDYESDTKEYVVEITATEDATTGTGNTATARITIRITNEQEGIGSFTITGNVGANASLVVDSTTHPDPDGIKSISYQWYSLDSAGGNRQDLGNGDRIALGAAPDFSRTYHVEITHIDQLDVAHTQVLMASAVRFFDKSNPPEEVPSYSRTIAEGSTSGLPDIDAELTGATLTYAFAPGGNADGIFAIDSTTGALSLAANMELDYEAATSYRLIVRASELGGDAYGDVNVVINLLDVNDNPPQFDPDNVLTAMIAESRGAADGVFLTITATDTDGTSANRGVGYAITGGTGMGKFAIDDDGGISVATGTTLDYDTDPATTGYTLEITATDSGTPAMATPTPLEIAITMIDVNDITPMLSAINDATTATINENAMGVDAGDIRFTIADADTNNGFAPERFSITATGTTSTDSAAKFRIVADGNAWKLKLRERMSLDRETDGDRLELSVKVNDGRANLGDSNSVGIIINVGDENDHAPTLDVAGTGRIAEQIAATHPAVDVGGITLTTADADIGNNAVVEAGHFTINGDPDARFEIVADGVNTWKLRLKANEALNFETEPMITLTITLDDRVNPAFTTEDIVIAVSNVDDGEARFFVQGDPNTDATISAEIESGGDDPDGINGGYSYQWFTTTDKGITKDYITSANAKVFAPSTHALQTGEIYGVEVAYIDKAGVSYSGDTAPIALATALRFTGSYSITLRDGSDSVALPTLEAELNTDPNAAITYDFTSDGNPGGVFAISEAGVLSLVSAVDYDTASAAERNFNIKVIATATAGGETAIAPIPVSVSDANDNTPRLAEVGDTTATIAENTEGVDAGAISFTITDADEDATNDFTAGRFSITATGTTSSTSAAKFRIVADGDSWKLALKERMSLDRETDGDRLELSVKVNDGRVGVGDSNSIGVTIHVMDANDNPPMLSASGVVAVGDVYPVEMMEAQAGAETGISFMVADADSDATNGFDDDRFAVSAKDAGDSDAAAIAALFGVAYDATTKIGTLRLKTGMELDREAAGLTADGKITLIVKVNDGNADSNEIEVEVTINDLNEHAPILTASTTSADMGEVHGATDDVDTGITFTLTDADSAKQYDANDFNVSDSRFAVANVGGVWRLLLSQGETLDYETEQSLSLIIKVADSATPAKESNSETITINVGNANDNPPVFEAEQATWQSNFADGEVAETTDGSVTPVHIANVNVRDADRAVVSDFGVLEYRLVNDYGKFSIDDAGGITLTATLDRDGANPDPAEYSLVATISDGDTSITTDPIIVKILHVDESDPEFDDALNPVDWEVDFAGGRIAEGTYTNERIGILAASDADSDAALTYSIVSGGDGLFSIKSGTNQLILNGVLDYDTATGGAVSHTLIFGVSDGSGAVVESDPYTINVVNENDNDPQFGAVRWVAGTPDPNNANIVTIDEGSTGNLLTIPASDADAGGALQFSILSGDNAIFTFAASGDGGLLTISGDLDYESPTKSHTLTLQVEDDGGRPDTHDVTINVRDINDNAPIPMLSATTGIVSQRFAGNSDAIDSSITFTLSDADSAGVNPLVTEAFFSVSDDRFEVVADGNNWKLRLKANAALSYQTEQSVMLTISVDDDTTSATGNTHTTDTITLNVGGANNSAPVFDSGLNLSPSISESRNAAAGIFTSVTATDADDSFNDVGYAITGGTGMGKFTIGDDGGIRVADGVVLDYDTDPATDEYTLIITATDNHPMPMTETEMVTITIADANDIAPVVVVDANNSQGALTEEVLGAAGDGTGTGYIITITDADTDNRFTFDIMDGEADRFAFVHDAQADSWELTLIAGAKVDYETDTETLTIRYRVNDGVNDASAIESAQITITDANDHAPTLTIAGTGLIDEQIGSTHGAVDAGITFTLNDVDVSANNPTPSFSVNDARFRVVDVNGVWTLQLKPKAVLDYEFEQTITTLRVTADDGTNPPYQTPAGAISLTIRNVDDGDAAYAITAAPTAEGHRLEAGLMTADPDGVDTDFPLTYQWFTTTDGGVTKTPLTTDADGDSYVLKMDDSALPDYGVTVSYTDISGKKENVDALITLFPVIATGSGAVEENDRGADTGITLSVGNGFVLTSNDMFAVLGSDGQEDERFEVVEEADAWKLKLKANTSLDAEEATSIDLRIALTNRFVSRNKVVPLNVQIAVDNIDDRGPAITLETLHPPGGGAVVFENANIGDLVHEFEIIDDIGAFDGLILTFEDTGRDISDDNKFRLTKELRVDAETGKDRIFVKVELARKLDYEEYTRLADNHRESIVPKITGTIEINGESRSAFDDVRLTIHIANINDTAPKLELPDGTNSAVARIDENTAGVAFNIIIKASDLDDAASKTPLLVPHNLPPTEFTFIIRGDQAYKFEIAESLNADYRWQLKLKEGQSLDYERTDTLNLQIFTSDGVNISAPILVTINVNDDTAETNTHNPYFTSGDIAVNVFENIAAGARIATLTALDGDAGDTLTYSIIAGNERGLFALDANTGALSIAKMLDYETSIIHALTIQASDGNGKTDNAEVVVNVLDISPEPPAPTDTTPSVNDIIPTFTRAIGSPANGVIDETDADGNAEDVSTGYRIRITDADSNNNFTFGLNDDRFKFEDQGGGIWELFLKASSVVDYDMAGGESIALSFLINDGVNNAARNGAVQVRVNDINDNAPVITISGTGQIDEQISAAHDAVYAGITFAISDMDTGIGTNPNLFFRVERPHQDRFELVPDGDTLKLYLKADAVLDYETEATINGVAVTISQSPYNYVSPAGAVTLHVQNKDEGDAVYRVNGAATAIGNTLTLEQITDDPDGIKAGTFSYQWFTSTDDGVTKNMIQNANSDSYTLKIGDSTTALYGVTIEYTDNANTPESIDALLALTASGNGEVTENVRGADTGITLSVDSSYGTIDSDSFSVMDSDGQVDDRFEVVSENNAWKLKLKSNTSLDAEQGTKINLKVGLDNQVAAVDVQIAVKDVNDTRPDFTDETYRARFTPPDIVIYEDAEVGTMIYEYEVVDDVGTDDFNFFFSDLGIYSEDNKFMLTKETQVDEETGRTQIFLRIELARGLDYEEYTRHKEVPREFLSTAVTGSYLDFRGETVKTTEESLIPVYILNRNDTPPELELRDGTNSAIAQIDENTDGASVALNIMFKASDLDDSFSTLRGHRDHNLPATEYTFTITGDQAHKFEVVASGDADYAWQLNLKAGQSLDYERAGTLNLQIFASDGVNISAPISVTINVNDDASETNPNNPYFTNDNIDLDVLENIAVDATIATLTALDGDGDTITYAITGGNANTQFAIDQNTGALTIAKALDYETTPTHTITITANDGNGKTEEITATINVLDIDPEPAPAPDDDPLAGITPLPSIDPDAG